MPYNQLLVDDWEEEHSRVASERTSSLPAIVEDPRNSLALIHCSNILLQYHPYIHSMHYYTVHR